MFLREVDSQIGLSERLAKSIADGRRQSHVDHRIVDLLRQRAYQISCGYEDANDGDARPTIRRSRPSWDAIRQKAVRWVLSPAMTRLDNAVMVRDLLKLGHAFTVKEILRLAERSIANNVKWATRSEPMPPDSMPPSHGTDSAAWSAASKSPPRGTDVRCVVTSFREAGAKHLYDVVPCGRGKRELMIKAHKAALRSDRTRCHREEANPFRLFLHSAAYVPMHALRANSLNATSFPIAAVPCALKIQEGRAERCPNRLSWASKHARKHRQDSRSRFLSRTAPARSG